MVENAVYVWTGGANGEKISVFENIRIRVGGASGVRLLGVSDGPFEFRKCSQNLAFARIARKN